MVNDKKQVLHIPKDYVGEVHRQVQAGGEIQDAVREVLTTKEDCCLKTAPLLPPCFRQSVSRPNGPPRTPANYNSETMQFRNG